MVALLLVVAMTQKNKPSPNVLITLTKALTWLFLGFQFMVFGLLLAGKTLPISHSAFMLWHRLGGGQITHTWVDSSQISVYAKQAAVVSEDAKFVQHNGFDIPSIKKALRKNEQNGTIGAGGSTISQQLAKNLFLTAHRSYVRKAQEAIIVVMMEHIWDKPRILTVYLNVVEFGKGIYGIEAAAQHYFKKHANQLSKGEAALLIALLPNPKYYEKNLNNRRLLCKKQIILHRMPSALLPQSSIDPK